jgi:hypothetical protein
MVMPLRIEELNKYEIKAIEEFRSQRRQMRKSLSADRLCQAVEKQCGPDFLEM